VRERGCFEREASSLEKGAKKREVDSSALTEATIPIGGRSSTRSFHPLPGNSCRDLDPDVEYLSARRARQKARPRRPTRPGDHPGLHHQRISRYQSLTLSCAWFLRTARVSRPHRCRMRRHRTPDTIFHRTGEHYLPQFLQDLAAGVQRFRYDRQWYSRAVPPIRRDLIQRHRYLVPNSIVVFASCHIIAPSCYKMASSRRALVLYATRGRRAWRITGCRASTSTS